MSLTNNSLIIPYSLTGLSTLNGINPVGSITVTGQTAYLSATPVNANGNITLVQSIPTSSTLTTGLLSSSNFIQFNNKESPLTFNTPLLRTSNTVTIPYLTIAQDGLTQSSNYIGYQSGLNATGNNTIVIGRDSLKGSNTGSSNIIIGSLSSNQLTTGYANVCVGHQGLGGGNISTGYYNTLCGNLNYSGSSPSNMNNTNILGNSNVPNHSNCNVIGNSLTTQADNSSYLNNVRNVSNTMALSYNTTTKEITYETKASSGVSTCSLPLVITGANIALPNVSIKTTNTVVGVNSGGSLSDSNNTSIGAYSGNLTTGINNTSIGAYSGNSLTAGDNNTSIGKMANYLSSSSNNTSIGFATNWHSYGSCLHLSTGVAGPANCNGSGQWMGPYPWQNNTGGYYVSTGFGPNGNLIGYYYSSYLSDARTKSNITDADCSYYLDLVNTMRVRNFKYNDGKNNMNVGVITQEIERNENLRFLIDENEGYTFDINNFFKFDNVKMMVKKTIKTFNEETEKLEDTTEEKEEECLKIYIDTVKCGLIKGDYIRYSRDRDTKDIDFIEMEAEIIDCKEDYIIIENTDYIGIDDIGHDDSDLTTIFIEGKWVSDIKLIKKDAMAFVLLPAIQQLSRENDELKSRLAVIEAKLRG